MSDADAPLPDDYPRFLEQLKTQVRHARIRASRAANTELLTLYWNLGHAIRQRQQSHGWGTKVIDQLAHDLRVEFPHLRGLSRRDLFYMRSFAEAWPHEIVQQSVAQLPWGMSPCCWTSSTIPANATGTPPKLPSTAGPVTSSPIRSQDNCTGGSGRRRPTSRTTYPPQDSDLAQQLVRDPYIFDFLDLTERVAERDLEAALMTRLERFLLELGHGFAFVGRQYYFSVDGDDFYIDLLFFNWTQSRFVVVELKIGRFEPEYAGKLGFYVSWVDENLRIPDRHAPTIGILLCAGRNDNVVRYSLAGTTAPLAVANYTYDTLPDPIRELVPTDTELATAVDATWNELDTETADKRHDRA